MAAYHLASMHPTLLDGSWFATQTQPIQFSYNLETEHTGNIISNSLFIVVFVPFFTNMYLLSNCLAANKNRKQII
jgi:hypothetical protein